MATSTLMLVGLTLAGATVLRAETQVPAEPQAQGAVTKAEKAASEAAAAASKAALEAEAAARAAADAAADAAAKASDAAAAAVHSVAEGATTGALPDPAEPVVVPAAEAGAEAAAETGADAAASAADKADAAASAADKAAEAAGKAAATAGAEPTETPAETPAEAPAEATAEATAEVGTDPAAPPPVIAPDVNAPAISEAEPGVLSSWITSRNIWTTNRPSTIVWVAPTLTERPGDWQNIAKVADIVLDDSGQVVGYIADIGGFLGIGAKKVLLGVGSIHLVTIGDNSFFATNYTKEELEALPDFDEKTVRK